MSALNVVQLQRLVRLTTHPYITDCGCWYKMKQHKADCGSEVQVWAADRSITVSTFRPFIRTKWTGSRTGQSSTCHCFICPIWAPANRLPACVEPGCLVFIQPQRSDLIQQETTEVQFLELLWCLCEKYACAGVLLWCGDLLRYNTHCTSGNRLTGSAGSTQHQNPVLMLALAPFSLYLDYILVIWLSILFLFVFFFCFKLEDNHVKIKIISKQSHLKVHSAAVQQLSFISHDLPPVACSCSVHIQYLQIILFQLIQNLLDYI